MRGGQKKGGGLDLLNINFEVSWEAIQLWGDSSLHTSLVHFNMYLIDDKSRVILGETSNQCQRVKHFLPRCKGPCGKSLGRPRKEEECAGLSQARPYHSCC